jgi:hypothetical protein
MRKFLLAPLLTMVMVATVVFGVSFLMKPEPAKAEPVVQQACDSLLDQILCVRIEKDEIVVVNLLTNTVVVRQPIPKVTVSGPTITASLPRVTVSRAPVTVTLPRVTNGIVTLPRRTVTIELPRATNTVTVTVPGQTTVSAQTVTPTMVPVTVTGSNGQVVQTSVTITPSPQVGSVTTKPVVKEREVRVSIPTAIGIGVGVLLLGLILGLLAIYVAYAVGYKDSESAERINWRRFRDELFGKKDEGEN